MLYGVIILAGIIFLACACKPQETYVPQTKTYEYTDSNGVCYIITSNGVCPAFNPDGTIKTKEATHHE